MADLGTLFVAIDATTKDFDKKINQSEKKTIAFGDSLNSLSKTASIAIAGIGISAIKFASDAEEARAKFLTAFSGIEGKADETAQSLALSYGLSIGESEKLLGNTGDLLKGFGATAGEALELSAEVQKLAVDLTSYNNIQGGAERASRILTKSILGNKDGLSELGVVLLDTDINQELVRRGQEGLTGQARLLAKAQATYSLILEQTGDAQGDYNRTSESTANRTKELVSRTKDLAVIFGRELLPVTQDVIGFAISLTQSLSSIDDSTKASIITIGGLVVALNPAIKAVNGLKVAFTTLNSPIGAVGIAIAGIIAGLNKLKEINAEKAQKTFGDLAESVNLTSTEIKKVAEIAQGSLNRAFSDKNQIAQVFELTARQAGLTNEELFKILDTQGQLSEQQEEAISLVLQRADVEDDLNQLKRDSLSLTSDIGNEEETAKTKSIELTESQINAYIDLNARVQEILDSNKSEIELIDEQIESITKLKLADSTFRDDQQKALKQLQDKKQELIDEDIKNQKDAEQAKIDEALKAADKSLKIVDERDAEIDKKREENIEKEKEANERILQSSLETAESLIGIIGNTRDAEIQALEQVANKQLDALNAETEQESALNAFKAQLSQEELERSEQETEQKIQDLKEVGDEDSTQEANELQRDLDNARALRELEEEALKSREENAAEQEKIQQDLAQKIYEIELEQFRLEKAAAIIQAGINTALAVTSLGVVTPAAIAAGVAGAAQVAFIASQPEPPIPAFAEGGAVKGARVAVVGEDRGEVMFGMGAKGAPMFQEFIDRTVAGLKNGGQTIVNINSLYPPRRRDLERLARDLYNPQIKEQQRRGANG